MAEADNLELRSQLQSKDKEVHELKNQADLNQQQLNRLQKLYVDASNELKAAKRSLSQLNEIIANFENDDTADTLRHEYQVQMAELEKTLLSCQDQVKGKNKEITELLNSLQNAQSSVDGLNKQIQQLRNKNLYHEKQLTEQRAQLDQLKAKLESKDKELEENSMASDEKIEKSMINFTPSQQALTDAELNAALNAEKKDKKDKEDKIAKEKTQLHDTKENLAAAAPPPPNAKGIDGTPPISMNKPLSLGMTKADCLKDPAATADGGKLTPVTSPANKESGKESSLEQLRQKTQTENAELLKKFEDLKSADTDDEVIQQEINPMTKENISLNERIIALTATNNEQKQQLEEAQSKANASGQLDILKSLNEKLQTRDHEQKLNMDTLYDEIQSLTQDSLHNSQMDTSLNSTKSGDVTLADVVDNLRKIKDKEMEMRIAAQIELSRIKAQAHIDEQKIDQLSGEVVQLKETLQISSEWKIKYEKLEEQLRDKQKTEEALNERVNSQMELISQLRITNGRIGSDLEYQKKNQETAFKNVNEFEKEIAKKNEQIAKHKAQLENDEQRIQKLTNEIFKQQDELTKLNVNLRLLNDKYDVARNDAVSYEAQVKVLRENRYSAERTNLTLEGIENILKVKENEKIEQMKSQLDALMIERDNYKNAVEDLRSHSERRNIELQATLGEAVAAKNKLQIELKYHREQYSSLEQLLQKTQTENAELLKKFQDLKSADTSVDGLNEEIQQLRNKNLYHEKQLTEQRAQLDQLKAKLESRDKELEELQRINGGLENTMKSQDELQQQQQTRLQKECKDLTNELEAARKTIEELNAKIFDSEARESSHGHTVDTLRHEYQVQIAELQKSLASYQNQVEGKTKEITELLNSLQNVQSDRDNTDARVKLMDDQLVASEQQIAQLKADLKASHERFETASNEHDAMVSRLRNSVVLLEQENGRLNEGLSELPTETAAGESAATSSQSNANLVSTISDAHPSSSSNEVQTSEMDDVIQTNETSEGRFIFNKKKGISVLFQSHQYNKYNYDTMFKCNKKKNGIKCTSTITTKNYDRDTIQEGDICYIVNTSPHSCHNF